MGDATVAPHGLVVDVASTSLVCLSVCLSVCLFVCLSGVEDGENVNPATRPRFLAGQLAAWFSGQPEVGGTLLAIWPLGIQHTELRLSPAVHVGYEPAFGSFGRRCRKLLRGRISMLPPRPTG